MHLFCHTCSTNHHRHFLHLGGYVIAMTPRQKRTLQFGEWVIDDLRLQTDKLTYPFCVVPPPGKRTEAVDRTAALGAMYVRLLEQAENLGLLRIGESAQVKRWLTSGVLFR